MDDAFAKTYGKMFEDWWREESLKPEYATSAGLPAIAVKFCAYLDRGAMTMQLQILAMLQARKIDQEVLSALIDEIGVDRAKELVMPIHARFQTQKKNAELAVDAERGHAEDSA